MGESPGLADVDLPVYILFTAQFHRHLDQFGGGELSLAVMIEGGVLILLTDHLVKADC